MIVDAAPFHRGVVVIFFNELDHVK
ncbi:MAG: hypothetical protein AVDCRST_MAG73-2417, partial [uncultured Thermomicrobiales bacterium]